MHVARQRRPELALVDVSMPDMDGLQVCRALRADPATAGMAIMLLSAWAMRDDINAGLQAGADVYLPKPFVTAELLSRVQPLLTGRRRQEGVPDAS